VTLLLDLVKAFFVQVLAMRNEARIFGRPSRVRSPVIIENLVAELITATARLQSFLISQQC